MLTTSLRTFAQIMISGTFLTIQHRYICAQNCISDAPKSTSNSKQKDYLQKDITGTNRHY